MKVLKFECDNNLEQYVDSMLFDSDTTIASLEVEEGDHKITIDLMVRGEVKVYYNDEVYREPSSFPDSLKELIRENPNHWFNAENVYVDMNNWFEYIYNDIVDGETESDGVMMEHDLSIWSA